MTADNSFPADIPPAVVSNLPSPPTGSTPKAKSGRGHERALPALIGTTRLGLARKNDLDIVFDSMAERTLNLVDFVSNLERVLVSSSGNSFACRRPAMRS